MGFFKNIGTESIILCKRLADFNLKPSAKSSIHHWTWLEAGGIMRNTGTCAVARYLLDSKRINIDDLIKYVYRIKSPYDPEAVKKSIEYNIDRIAVRIYNPKSKTLYCYGGPNGGMTDKHAERIFNDAVELLKYLNIKYIKKGSSKQHNVRIVLI